MNKLKQITDNLNSLSPSKRIVLMVIGAMLMSVLLFFISILAAPKKAPKQIPPPIPVFNPSPSTKISPGSIKPGFDSQASQLQGLSVASPVIENDFIYYLSDGQTTFYKSSFDGKEKQQLTEPLVAQIKQVIWSPDKSSAILKIENNKYFLGKNNSPFLSKEDDNLTITNWYYNFLDGSFKKLNSKIEPISFSPDGKKIAYITEGEQQTLNRLFVANPDGSNEQFILTLEESTQDNLVFIDNDNIITYAKPHGYGRNFLYITNLPTKTSQKLTENSFTFGANPSPKGDLILAQTVKEDPDVFYKNFLSIIEVQNKKLTVLDIQTSPDLATWSADGNSIYAFEPGKLWLINTANLSKELISLPTEFSQLKIDENSLMVSPSNSILFFSANSKLYSLQLK